MISGIIKGKEYLFSQDESNSYKIFSSKIKKHIIKNDFLSIHNTFEQMKSSSDGKNINNKFLNYLYTNNLDCFLPLINESIIKEFSPEEKEKKAIILNLLSPLIDNKVPLEKKIKMGAMSIDYGSILNLSKINNNLIDNNLDRVSSMNNIKTLIHLNRFPSFKNKNIKLIKSLINFVEDVMPNLKNGEFIKKNILEPTKKLSNKLDEIIYNNEVRRNQIKENNLDKTKGRIVI